MAVSRHPQGWFALALLMLLALVAVVWLPTVVTPVRSSSPLPTPVGSLSEDSLTPAVAATPYLLSPSIGAALLWVGLGILLGVGIVLTTLYWQRR